MNSNPSEKARQGRKPQVIGGVHPVLEALKAGVSIDKVYIRTGLIGPQVQEIRQSCRERSIPIREVPIEKFRKLGITRAQGVAASLAAVEFAELETTIAQIFESGATPLLVMLDGVTDVRNLGSIARSALCAGGHGLIVTGHHTAALHHQSVKASAGALLHLKVHRVLSASEGIRRLKHCGVRTLALSEKGSQILFNADLTGPLCLIAGDEEKGISSATLRQCDEVLRIPMPGKFASLNVAHAAAVALFEAVRQRLA